jgi:uncharacterized protein DUF222/HNH endonuclease
VHHERAQREPGRATGELISRMDAAHVRASSALSELFELILDAEAAEIWVGTEARDLAHGLCMRYSISTWKAHRWINAAHGLADLPQLGEAFETGVVGVDKVVELTRFATPETESRLVKWATTVSGTTIRRRGDLEARDPIEPVQDADRDRFLDWWYYDEGRRFHLEAELPAANGAVIARAVARAADQVPQIPGEEPKASTRRADGLVGICRGRIASDPDPDRATVVVHVRATPVGGSGPEHGSGNGASVTGEPVPAGFEIGACEIEGGPVIHPLTAGRLMCDARIQTVLEDSIGMPIRLGRISREPSAAIMRQLRYRDRCCQFPGCGSTRFLHAHHISWWSRGGPTDPENLILLCTFHHKLVHEHGWKVFRDPNGTVRWFHPDGTRYRTGPSPPRESALAG